MKTNFLGLVLVIITMSACVFERTEKLPESLAENAIVKGFATEPIRVFGDASRFELQDFMFSAVPDLGVTVRGNGRLHQDFLVLSGGGARGAYGAGLINGWTKAGNRPEFVMVTGVSTGAIIAPFAFLGPDYDHFLTEFYTQYSTKDILRKQVVAGLLGSPSVASSEPLAKLIERFVTVELLQEIAAEYAKGRFLLVGTTNLDVERPVIWNMGAIASRGGPEGLQLFRDVIRASISIPAVFEPVLFEVMAGEFSGQELHVDGGTTDNAILVPLHVQLNERTRRQRFTPKRRLFVVVNSNLRPDVEYVDTKALSIAAKSIDVLLHQQTSSDVGQLKRYASRNGMQFHFTQIPDSFTREPKEVFDREYMRALYNLGEKLMLEGNVWDQNPDILRD